MEHSVDGRSVALADARSVQLAVNVRYQGEWCPYCNITRHTFQEKLIPALGELGFLLMAASPEKPDGILTMQEKHDLTFTVLADPGNQIASPPGVLTHSPDAVRGIHAQMGGIVAAGNADGTDGLPMPLVVVVDASRTFRGIDVHPNHTTRSEQPDMLAAIAAFG
jgi:peroxiredoxin